VKISFSNNILHHGVSKRGDGKERDSEDEIKARKNAFYSPLI
jgi:hypothetical protein